jgi:hypothetical protein
MDMTPEPKRPLKVFLCHAHADRDPVRELYARLTKDGVDAWLDKEKLLPGTGLGIGNLQDSMLVIDV